MALYSDYRNLQMSSNLIWFQLNGAPAHYGQTVSDYLDTIFPNRWIGNRIFKLLLEKLAN